MLISLTAAAQMRREHTMDERQDEPILWRHRNYYKRAAPQMRRAMVCRFAKVVHSLAVPIEGKDNEMREKTKTEI